MLVVDNIETRRRGEYPGNQLEFHSIFVFICFTFIYSCNLSDRSKWIYKCILQPATNLE